MNIATPAPLGAQKRRISNEKVRVDWRMHDRCDPDPECCHHRRIGLRDLPPGNAPRNLGVNQS